MPKVCIVRAIEKRDSDGYYEGIERYVQESDWAEVTDNALALLKRYGPKKGFHVLQVFAGSDVATLLDEATLDEKLEREKEAARRKAQEKRKKTLRERTLKRKKAQLEKLKEELGQDAEKG